MLITADPVFRATQEIAYNAKIMASAESTIKTCEEELAMLRTLGDDNGSWWRGTSVARGRARYLLEKMRVAQEKLEKLEKQNEVLKKTLAKGG